MYARMHIALIGLKRWRTQVYAGVGAPCTNSATTVSPGNRRFAKSIIRARLQDDSRADGADSHKQAIFFQIKIKSPYLPYLTASCVSTVL